MIQIEWRCRICDMSSTVEVDDLDTRMSHVLFLIKIDHDDMWAKKTDHDDYEVLGATGVNVADLS